MTKTSALPPMVSGGDFFIGHTKEMLRDRLPLFQRGYREHGGMFSVRLGLKKCVVLGAPEYSAFFFAETDKRLSSKEANKWLIPLFGETQFAGTHEKYVNQRPLTHQPFKRHKAPVYLRIMQKEIQQWLDQLSESGEIDLYRELVKVTQNISVHALCGERFKEDLGARFWELFIEVAHGLDLFIPYWLPLPRFRRRNRARREMVEILLPLVADRRQNPDKYDDFIQTIIYTKQVDGNYASDEDVINIIMGLTFGGYESAAIQGTWTVVKLIQNQWYLEYVLKEISEKVRLRLELGERGVSELDHILWAFDETNRIAALADVLMRMATEDIELGGYLIPKGSMVINASQHIQNLPELFANPHTYDPLRFSPERAEHKNHLYSITSFGGGLHKCPGMSFTRRSITILVALMLQQYEWDLITKDPKALLSRGICKFDEVRVRYKRREQPLCPM